MDSRDKKLNEIIDKWFIIGVPTDFMLGLIVCCFVGFDVGVSLAVSSMFLIRGFIGIFCWNKMGDDNSFGDNLKTKILGVVIIVFANAIVGILIISYDKISQKLIKNNKDKIVDRPDTETKETELYSYVDSSKESMYFGSYPQTEIKDETLIMELNKKAGILPNKENTYNWIDYGYYIRGKIKSYMYYIDIELDGNKYRGVYFTQYRPECTTESSICENSFQDHNGYNTNTTYWFKYEPIKWNILKTENNKSLIICDLILDSQDYYYSTSSRSGATNYQRNTKTGTTYANNYMFSHIRSWLNETFYETAFSTLEKEIIGTTIVDNSASSTGYSSNSYACSNTRDKMFLLSYKEATTYYSSDSKRQAKGTNYAKSQGLYVSFDSSHSGYSYYWLRSPHYNYDDLARFVDYDGSIYSGYVYDADNGVRPACWINLKSKQNKIVSKNEILNQNDVDDKKVLNPILDKPKVELYSYVDSNKKSIYFGCYPQTAIKDKNLILELSEKAGILPTKSNTYNWKDYGYYIEGKVESYMYYIDTELDDNKYRGVYFTKIRSSNTSDSNTYQDDNGYRAKTTYWFKYEPIKWNIKETNKGKVLIISDLLLDSQDYYYSTSSYANNYMSSHIRNWLNNTFYETAFSTLEKEIIKTTTVDNSASSTRDRLNSYACGNTRDKMFLLSYKEAKTYYSSDSKRQAKGTDYAKSQGLYVNNTSPYWLRSPSGSGGECAWFVYYDGNVISDGVDRTDNGVRPACWINLKSKQNNIDIKDEILDKCSLDNKKVSDPILDKPKIDLQKEYWKK